MVKEWIPNYMVDKAKSQRNLSKGQADACGGDGYPVGLVRAYDALISDFWRRIGARGISEQMGLERLDDSRRKLRHLVERFNYGR